MSTSGYIHPMDSAILYCFLLSDHPVQTL